MGQSLFQTKAVAHTKKVRNSTFALWVSLPDRQGSRPHDHPIAPETDSLIARLPAYLTI